MGRIFFLPPPTVLGSLTLGCRGLCHSRGALPFFFNAFDVHRESGIPKASPTGVSYPRLIPQGPNLRFPTLHVTQAIKRPQLWSPGGLGANTAPCKRAVRCRGKVLAKCYGCEPAGLCTAHKDGLCVPCQEGEEPEGGEEEGWGIPMGSALRNALNACSRWEQPPGFFVEGVGWGGWPPLHSGGGGGLAGHPD